MKYFLNLVMNYCFENERLGADHLIFGGGGGGVGRFRLCKNFFPSRGIRQIFFSCKSAAQDIFFPIYFAAGYIL